MLIADVLTPHTTPLYRENLPGCLIVRLHVTPTEAHHRALTRPVYLTDAEFDMLHHHDRQDPPAADHHLDVTHLDLDQQVAAVNQLWWSNT
ncbi:MAG TPA: hypothetical protein VK453_11970 [Micromonosporaceae bacterium]|nr:hypothetical protein [Micromonosporaceae bacterium]